MKIYLSGPDCSGKSTLAKHYESIGYKIMKWSIPEQGEDYVKKALDQMNSSENLVLDRGWIGDAIYAPLFGRESVIDYFTALQLMKSWTSKGNLVFWVTANIRTIEKRLKERGDEYVDFSMLPKILSKYEKFYYDMAKLEIPFYKIDTSNL